MTLSSIQVLSILEICGILMISKDNYLLGRTLQDMVPPLKRMDGNLNLFIMDHVIDFHIFEYFGMRNNWMHLPIAHHPWLATKHFQV